MDEHLPFLSASDASHFRTVAHQAFGELGLEVTTYPDHAVDSAGRQYGFWNVATLCADVDRDAWPALVRDHVVRIVASLDSDPFDDADPTQVQDSTYARLYPAEAVPDLGAYPHRDFAPGIVEMLALDLPETVAVFTHEHARSNGGWELLHRAGTAHLRSLPTEQVEEVDAPGGGRFSVLLGESVYTASRALLLPHLPTGETNDAVPEHGWLMSVPNRHQLVWHVVRDSSVVGVVTGMARFTLLGHGDGVSPISPHVYWWNGTEYEQLTQIDDEGRLSIHPGPGFTDLLTRLATDG